MSSNGISARAAYTQRATLAATPPTGVDRGGAGARLRRGRGAPAGSGGAAVGATALMR